VRRGGRIDVVREAAGIAAYRTGRFAEALRELRTVRRLNGSSEHLAIMADAERGLGRPERAIALAATPEADTLDPYSKVELAIVVSGARSDLGEHDAALLALDKLPTLKGDLALRVLQARAAALEAAGRTDEAEALLADIDPEDLERAAGNAEPEDEVVVYDIYDEDADDEDADDEDADDVDADDVDADDVDADDVDADGRSEDAPEPDDHDDVQDLEGADVEEPRP
jgi:tetratricopeptide (TPR) repeat protein